MAVAEVVERMRPPSRRCPIRWSFERRPSSLARRARFLAVGGKRSQIFVQVPRGRERPSAASAASVKLLEIVCQGVWESYQSFVMVPRYGKGGGFTNRYANLTGTVWGSREVGGRSPGMVPLMWKGPMGTLASRPE